MLKVNNNQVKPSQFGKGGIKLRCSSLGSPKKNLMLCFLTGLPSATTRIRMKKNHIVAPQSKKSKHGGNNAKIGWHTSKSKCAVGLRLQESSEGTIG